VTAIAMEERIVRRYDLFIAEVDLTCLHSTQSLDGLDSSESKTGSTAHVHTVSTTDLNGASRTTYSPFTQYSPQLLLLKDGNDGVVESVDAVANQSSIEMQWQ
jgi:hypothetical protein